MNIYHSFALTLVCIAGLGASQQQPVPYKLFGNSIQFVYKPEDTPKQTHHVARRRWISVRDTALVAALEKALKDIPQFWEDPTNAYIAYNALGRPDPILCIAPMKYLDVECSPEEYASRNSLSILCDRITKNCSYFTVKRLCIMNGAIDVYFFSTNPDMPRIIDQALYTTCKDFLKRLIVCDGMYHEYKTYFERCKQILSHTLREYDWVMRMPFYSEGYADGRACIGEYTQVKNEQDKIDLFSVLPCYPKDIDPLTLKPLGLCKTHIDKNKKRGILAYTHLAGTLSLGILIPSSEKEYDKDVLHQALNILTPKLNDDCAYLAREHHRLISARRVAFSYLAQQLDTYDYPPRITYDARYKHMYEQHS